MSWVHTGSQTRSTVASSMLSMVMMRDCASAAMTGPIPQPGAVSVILTLTVDLLESFSDSLIIQSYTSPRFTMSTGISGSYTSLSAAQTCSSSGASLRASDCAVFSACSLGSMPRASTSLLEILARPACVATVYVPPSVWVIMTGVPWGSMMASPLGI